LTETRLDNPSLVRDLVGWLCERPRSYEEVMEAWRTSCPRLTVWEDAVDAGFVSVSFAPSGQGRIVSVSDAGRRFLEESGDAA
jgi:hypothetical protein